MKTLKLIWGLLLLGLLVLVIQLAEPPPDSPAVAFERLPQINITQLAEAEAAAGRTDNALFLLDYTIESDLPQRVEAAALRQRLAAQLALDRDPFKRLQAPSAPSDATAGNSFASLAGSSVADMVMYGELASLAKHNSLENQDDDFIAALNRISPLRTVFPPAESTIILLKAARRSDALNASLTRQLGHILTLIQTDPRSAVSLEQFRENFMPLFELARRCRSWGEYQVILRHADSPDQVKVLTKMVSASPSNAKRLSQVLTVAAHGGEATSAVVLDHVLRHGQAGLDSLHAAARKGPPALKLVAEHPTLSATALRHEKATDRSWLASMQHEYQALRMQHGPVIAAAKYLVIAILSTLLVLVVIPAAYLGRLVASTSREGHEAVEPSPAHSILAALTVGVVLAALAYLFTMAMQVAPETSAAAANTALGTSASGTTAEEVRNDSALLSGTVVLLSLLTHAVIWFYVRSKLKDVEDDQVNPPALRLKRLENMEVFLDLPLFCGLALTVIAFILITLDAGMSRHFAYTSTVVGILSAVSLRIRYLYPLKEQLIQYVEIVPS